MPQKKQYKSCFLAVGLSILYPGLGHCYVGAYLTGLLWAIAAFLTQWFIYNCHCHWQGFHEAGGWLYVIVYAAIILISSVRAHIIAVQINQHIELIDKAKKEGKQKDHGYDLLKKR
jgi:hypothetical protein